MSALLFVVQERTCITGADNYSSKTIIKIKKIFKHIFQDKSDCVSAAKVKKLCCRKLPTLFMLSFMRLYNVIYIISLHYRTEVWG